MVMLRSDLEKQGRQPQEALLTLVRKEAVQPKLEGRVGKKGEALNIEFDDLNKDAQERVKGLFKKVFPKYVMGAIPDEVKKAGEEGKMSAQIATVMKALQHVLDDILRSEDVVKKTDASHADTWEFTGLLDMPSPKFTKKKVAKADQDWGFSGLCDL